MIYMVYIVYMDTNPIGFYDPNDYYVIWFKKTIDY